MPVAMLLHKSGTSLVARNQPSCRQQRSLVLARASGDVEPSATRKPLFQLDERQRLNMEDIMDAYDVCSLIPDPNERHQCYSVFGLDAHKMNNYYETVVRLEQQLSTDLDNTSVFSGRWPHLWQQMHPPQQPPSFLHNPFSKANAITGSTPPPPAAAAALAVAMLSMAAQHLAWF